MSDAWLNQAERVDGRGLNLFLRRIAARYPLNMMTFLCLGTDRSTGDCLGPLIGTLLEEANMSYDIIGTLACPCDAEKLPEVLPRLPSDKIVLAIDACLGRPESVGSYLVSAAPLVPARSVGKTFPPVGTFSIAGIVNATGPKPYWTLQTTSLYSVMNMAREVSQAILQSWTPDIHQQATR